MSPDSELVIELTGAEAPTEADGRDCLAYVSALVEHPNHLPTIDLVGAAEGQSLRAALRVVEGPSAGHTVDQLGQLVAHLAAPSVRRAPTSGEAASTGQAISPAAMQLLVRRDQAISERDRVPGAQQPPLIVAVVLVQATWSAVAEVVQRLRARDDVRLEVVAVETRAAFQATTTAEFLRAQGIEPRDVSWLEAQASDPAGGLSIALYYDPYDEMYPEAARARRLVQQGIRIAYFPYSPNAAAGETMVEHAYDTPTHRSAWRIYARSPRQRALFAEHCAVGAAQVRVLGVAKIDRVLAAATHDNIEIDESGDYLDSFARADAMMSDLSSLLTEFFPTGRPILYLHRDDGPGLNEDADYFLGADVARTADDIVTFLDNVRTRVDPGRSRRQLALERHFPLTDGHASERIADEMVADLLAEIDAHRSA